MSKIIENLARLSAIMGGLVLTALAILMTVSILGGAIADFSHSEWAQSHSPALAQWIQDTGIRTIRGMYEIIKFGIAFVVFAFLPIASFTRAHAVVDVFTNFLPVRLNQFLIAFWELIFFVILLLITWRLFYGMERMMSSNVISQELKMPEWWGYAVAVAQMVLASIVSAYVAWAEWYKLFSAKEILPQSEGAAH